jgi:hypothetical protein
MNVFIYSFDNWNHYIDIGIGIVVYQTGLSGMNRHLDNLSCTILIRKL